jgi:colanic acid biosynthesis glycosyl transferase WcaI
LRILIHGINYSPELTGIGKYTGEMASWLADHGHDVRVVTGLPYYPAWRVADGYHPWRYRKEVIAGVPVWRCPLWVPRAPTALKRLLHLVTFMVSSLPVMLCQVAWRPELVLVIEPPLFCAPQALLTAWLARGKSWLHVQDFEVAAYFGLGFASSGALEGVCTTLEGRLMRCFDMVSSISRTMVSRLIRLGVPEEDAYLFPNWVDCRMMHPQIPGKDFRRAWQIPADCKVVLYSGNMGRKQGLDIVLYAAAEMAEQHPDVLFVMVGDGAAKQDLVAEAGRLGLKNIVFKPLQPAVDLQALLRMADLHLIIQKRGAADAVMPSKLGGIFAVGGCALITADPVTELGRLVTENAGIAMLVEPESGEALVDALLAALADPSLRKYAGQLARKFAENYLDIDRVLRAAEMRCSQLVKQ